ncbi:MAG: hypothetical protein A2W98_14690 [Bacteroidetes bacterium GWF2_33_38]|nr:MAG: hypothetical protein A2W98_14690 [Bacteroidetes bacterium GWF2_33_38]OFY68975.1 MAG: hypothetical protein A2265_07295 [Bacteroidetes bacterium RIFOXYA12_FULL_33_9]OFY92086.1 MAG: hypothetical protein A2236_07720 [Bacteroidetes bacterium RIFOXYA2_FULL_33_7]HBX52635.1 hypothetical protein [Bacteroidales bacterium]
MKKTSLFIGLILFASLFYEANAQQTIWLLNGQKIVTAKYSIVKETEMFYYQNKKGKTKDVPLEYVFSITDSLGKETVLYTPDSIADEGAFTYNETEMREYVHGRETANENYKGRLAFVSGFAIGAAAPIATSAAGINFFYAPLIPAVGTSAINLTKPSFTTFYKKYPDKKENLPFVSGYMDSAREKRTKNAIWGGLSGLGAGIIACCFLFVD